MTDLAAARFLRRSCVALLACGLLMACSKQSDPPPDLIKTQREALERAKAVSSVIEQGDQKDRQQIDNDSK